MVNSFDSWQSKALNRSPKLAKCKGKLAASKTLASKNKTQFNTKLSQWKKMVIELGATFSPSQRPLDHGLDVRRAVALLAPAYDAPRPARRPFS